jgi:hypothetical protein
MSTIEKKDIQPFAVISSKAINSSGGGGNVTSVFGRTGDVVANTGDYSVGQIIGAAPSNSPIFTGNPQAPTPVSTDYSTSLATTEFVQDLISQVNIELDYTTVGSGGDYPTVFAAIAAGKFTLKIISDTFEAQQIFVTSNLYILVDANVTWTLIRSIATPIFVDAVNIVIVLETAPTGKISFASFAMNSSLIGGNFTYTLYRKSCVIDFSSASIGVLLFDDKAKTIISEGITTILLPNFDNTGLFYNGSSYIYEGCDLRLVGGGSNCSNALRRNAGAGYFNSISFSGTFNTSLPSIFDDTPITLTNGAITIKSINLLFNVATTIRLTLSGTIQAIFNGNRNLINCNVTIGAARTNLNNADLGTGTLEVNFHALFTGINIRSSNLPNNAIVGTLFTNCRFGLGRATSVGGLVENQNSLRLFASSVTGSDALNNGTINYPYSTIGTTIANSTNNSLMQISGTFTENVVFNTGSNQTLNGQNTLYDLLTTINGQVQITGTASQVFLSNLAIATNVATPIAINALNGFQGLENVSIITTQANAISIDYSTLSTTAAVSVSNCDFSNITGIINLIDITGGGTATIKFVNCIKPNIYVGTGWIVELYNTDLGVITGNIANIVNKKGMSLVPTATLDNFASFDSMGQVKDSNIPSGILIKTATTTALYSGGSNGVNQIFFDYTDGLEYSVWQCSDIQGIMFDPRYFLDQNAYIGIGGTFSLANRPTSKLDVDGDVEIEETSAFYIGDPNTDGSWRWRILGDDLVYERRESSTWFVKQTFLPINTNGGIDTETVKTDNIESASGGAIDVNSVMNFISTPSGIQTLVSGATAGNIATLNSSGQVIDSGSPISTFTPVFTKTYYAAPSPLGQPTNNGFTPQSPMDLQTMLNSLGSSGNQGVMAPGTYTGTFTIPTNCLNANIAGGDGGICFINGTLNINANGASSNRFSGFAVNTINLNGTAGVYFVRNITVNTAVNKTSSCYWQVTDNSDLQGGTSSCLVNITGAGSVNFWANTKAGITTINNAGAQVSYHNVPIAGPITLTAGVLGINNSVVFSATPTSNAVTATGGTIQMQNLTCFTTSLTPARINIGASANYIFVSSSIDIANSVLAGVNIGAATSQNIITSSAADTYSTNEIYTGKTWLNGKPIYRKCYTLTNIDGSSEYTIDAALTNSYISQLVKLEASGQTPIANGSVWFASNLNDGGALDWRVYIDSAGLKFLSNIGSVTTAQILNIIAEYTK